MMTANTEHWKGPVHTVYSGDDLLTWLDTRQRFDHFAHTVEDGGNVLTSISAPCENSKAAADRIRKAEADLRLLQHAVFVLLAWDERRGYPVPYRVRDLLINAVKDATP